MSGLTHFDAKGDAHMVDVSDKDVTSRIAVAEGFIKMAPETFAIITEGRAKKGDVIGVARLAGIMGAKKTSDLIPLCNPLPITKVSVEFTQEPDLPGLRAEATVKTTGQTGVEMEAMTAASVAALTIYDMVKSADRFVTINGVRLLEKSGGASGHWKRPAPKETAETEGGAAGPAEPGKPGRGSRRSRGPSGAAASGKPGKGAKRARSPRK